MTSDPAKLMDRAFGDLIGQPAWQVVRGVGSFVTMEFGKPRLEISEPRVSTRKSKKVRDLLAQRRVRVSGQWHLWIYCCDWTVRFDGRAAAHSESRDEVIDRALRRLDGQKLSAVRLEDNGCSTFEFDLGGTLATRPYSDGDDESWMLFAPRGRVLSFNRDGSLRWGRDREVSSDVTAGQ